MLLLDEDICSKCVRLFFFIEPRLFLSEESCVLAGNQVRDEVKIETRKNRKVLSVCDSYLAEIGGLP